MRNDPSSNQAAIEPERLGALYRRALLEDVIRRGLCKMRGGLSFIANPF